MADRELVKLPFVAAAVYYNEWIQPVLCKIHKHEVKDSIYEYHRERNMIEETEYGILRT